MNESVFGDDLIAASESLPILLHTCLDVCQNSQNRFYRNWQKFGLSPDGSLHIWINTQGRESEFGGLFKYKDLIKEKAPGVISIIDTSLPWFTEFSEPTELLLEPILSEEETECRSPEEGHFTPTNIIGTSAHHAGILLLQEALSYDFWGYDEEAQLFFYPPKFDLYKLANQIKFERMKLVTIWRVRNDEYSNPVSSDQSSEPEIFDPARRTLTIGDLKAKFTQRTFGLIYYLYKSKTKSASFKDLREHVWVKPVNDKAILTAKDRCNTILLDAGLSNLWSLSGSEPLRHIRLEISPHK